MSAGRLTQDDWCNAPQPGNWRNACMRSPEHDGAHAVRKSYRLGEAFAWDGESYPVHSVSAEPFPDLWSPSEDAGFTRAVPPPSGGTET